MFINLQHSLASHCQQILLPYFFLLRVIYNIFITGWWSLWKYFLLQNPTYIKNNQYISFQISVCYSRTILVKHFSRIKTFSKELFGVLTRAAFFQQECLILTTFLLFNFKISLLYTLARALKLSMPRFSKFAKYNILSGNFNYAKPFHSTIRLSS